MQRNGTIAKKKIAEEEDEFEDKVEKEEIRLPERDFEARESLLTELMENKHIKAIYHFFAAAIIGITINSIIHACFRKGDLHLGLRILRLGFRKLDTAIGIWAGINISACLVFTCFNIWAWIRCQLKPKSSAMKLWDKLCLGLLILYYFMHYFLAIKSVRYFDVGGGCTFVLLTEATRLLMKIHAFVRSSAAEVVSYKPHTEQRIPLKRFTKFLYFLFAPTLIYRDEYPRTSCIRWSFVAKCVLEVALSIIFLSYTVEIYFVKNLIDFGAKTYTWEDILLIIFGSIFAGTLFLVLTFYIVLHSWQNAFAEVLTFADRQFYTDWWTSTTYARYLKTWNILVYNWLYTYVYKDMYEYVLPKNKAAAKATVIFLSAAVHELILTVSLRMFFPILFILFFAFGLMLTYIRTSNNFIWHALFLYSYSFGWGLQMSVYAMEFFVNLNNPVKNTTTMDYFIPRTFTCDNCIS